MTFLLPETFQIISSFQGAQVKQQMEVTQIKSHPQGTLQVTVIDGRNEKI